MKSFVKSILTFSFWIGLILVFYHCPIKLMFKIDCPACGISRAYKKLVKLDIIGAFKAHSLFPLPIIALSYHIFRDKIKLKTELIILLFFIAIFIVRWIIKIT